MQGFSGFPRKTTNISVPSQFFSELLPAIDDLAEMKVTVYCFWALQRQEGRYHYVRRSELEGDALFMAGLGADEDAQQAALQAGLERAVARGTLLHVTLRLGSQDDDIYFMNTPNGRNAVQAIEAGQWVPGDAKRPIQLIVERPNIFVLYEQNIGSITPYMADQLRAAEEEYPLAWIVEAIHIAAERNARNWRYISKILERWHQEGRDPDGFSGKGPAQSETPTADYSDLIES